MNKVLSTIIFCLLTAFGSYAQTSDELLDKVPSYAMFGDFKEALDIINQAVEADPANARAYYERAKFVLMLKGIEDDYGETLKKDAAAKQSAEIFKQIGKDQVYDYVIKDATKALELKNGYAEALKVRAEAHERNGNIALASDDLSSIIEINPKNTEAYYKRGKININLEKYAQAVADFTYLVNNGEAYDEIFFLRGSALVGMNSMVDACEDFSKVKKPNTEIYDSFDCDEHYLNRKNFKPKECKKFKTGKYKYSQYPLDNIYIERSKDKQIQQLPSGKVVFDVKWLSKTSYKLTYLESDFPSSKDKIGQSIIVKITEVKGDAYTCETVIDGKLFRSTFIKIGK